MTNKEGAKHSWFYNWVVNNRLVSSLTVILLILLILFVLSKVQWLFYPIKTLFGIIGTPIIIAGVFYYLLNPIVDRVENRFKIKRVWSISAIFIVVLGLIVWGIVAIIPIIQQQIMSLLANWPDYWNKVVEESTKFSNSPHFDSFRDQLDNFNKQASEQYSKATSSFFNQTLNSVGGFVSRVTTIAVSIITAPFILFYLLKDGHKLPAYLVHFFPTKARKSISEVIKEMNSQVSNYVRGQLIVAFCVGVMFLIGYWIIGLKFALLLAISAGVLNLVPYIGSFLALVPALVVGAFISPLMLIKVIIVFGIEQTLEGRFISPLVLGNSLKIHPVTIIFVLLASGKLFGVLGVILGIPGYAVIRVFVTQIFLWYKRYSGLYLEEIDSESH
ncbi:AI-2E family transporter [Secundilactobacillus malefermentans]|uniref:AI-2E family transporter n=1 Tax=Secundilactobacillus malefermentans TaxID=176292 RepID=UPI0011CB91F3|nr:AI-2E family transporter [Secundilactobacillus malefermentans]QEA30893.1 AI-2E family transporter [Secundilactobacillus malefermentans]